MSRRRSRDDDDSPTQSSGAGPFGWGFGITCGVIVALLFFLVGIPVLCCGLGGLGFLGIGKVADQAAKDAAEARARHDGQEGDPKPPADGDKAAPDKALLEMGDGFLFGDVRVSVAGASFDFVPLKDFRGENKSADRLLIVKLRLQNTSPAKKVEFVGWSQPNFGAGNLATLGDDQGNHYKRITFGSSKVVGQPERGESIYPGKELGDVLIFEEPVAACQYLVLTLPGEALDLPGKEVKFRISHSAWDPSWKPPAKPKPSPPSDTPRADPPKPKSAPTVAQESDAKSYLRYAKQLLEAGDKATAREKLQKILDDYPDTKVAPEARELLDKLK